MAGGRRRYRREDLGSVKGKAGVKTVMFRAEACFAFASDCCSPAPGCLLTCREGEKFIPSAMGFCHGGYQWRQ